MSYLEEAPKQLSIFTILVVILDLVHHSGLIMEKQCIKNVNFFNYDDYCYYDNCNHFFSSTILNSRQTLYLPPIHLRLPIIIVKNMCKIEQCDPQFNFIIHSAVLNQIKSVLTQILQYCNVKLNSRSYHQILHVFFKNEIGVNNRLS